MEGAVQKVSRLPFTEGGQRRQAEGVPALPVQTYLHDILQLWKPL